MKFSRIFSVALLGIALFAAHAHALTITPVRLEIKGDPGTTLREEMTLINEQATDVVYYSSFANFEAQGDTGSPAFIVPTDDIGTWMKTSDSITLGPNESKTVALSIAIPSDASPGGHFGAIFWGTAPSINNSGQVAISAKTGMLVLLSVSGDIKEAGGLLDFHTTGDKFWYNTLPVSFEYRFKNDGGDRIKPAGTIKIRDTVFLPADRIDANPVQGNILPSSTRKFKVDWIKHPDTNTPDLATSAMHKFWHIVGYQWRNFALGYYSAHIDIAYGSQLQHAKAKTGFFVFPWQLVVVIIVVLFVVFWGGKKALKHYNRFIINKARGGYDDDFTIEKI